MPESTEPSLTQPVAGEAQSESANAVHSENDNSAPQDIVPPNFVEIYQILKPVVSPGEEEETDETVDEKSLPPEEQMTAEPTPHEPEQDSTEKEPLPSERIYEVMKKAFDRGDGQEAADLAPKYAAQHAAEKRAADQAQARAARTKGDP